jgi:hypothetical protein
VSIIVLSGFICDVAEAPRNATTRERRVRYKLASEMAHSISIASALTVPHRQQPTARCAATRHALDVIAARGGSMSLTGHCAVIRQAPPLPHFGIAASRHRDIEVPASQHGVKPTDTLQRSVTVGYSMLRPVRCIGLQGAKKKTARAL